MPADPNPPQVTLSDIFLQLGIVGPVFVLLAIALFVWLIILFGRQRPLCEYVAYIVAALYPFFIGVLGASLSAAHLIDMLGNKGISDLEASILAHYLNELLLRLIVGSAMTCVYLPFGILALVIRCPK
jgi:hypothetical protein